MSNKKIKFTFIDLFAGIWGFRIPLEECGGKSVGYSEVDKTALEIYRSNFKTSDDEYLGDITKLTKFPYADIVTGGVPCQSWSVAGKKHGFEDPRGALWFDTIKFVWLVKPKAFIFENVKWLADPRNKDNLELIIKSFEDLDYIVKYKVLNAFDFWLPQNRERVFIVGVQKFISKQFEFPQSYTALPHLSEILENFYNKGKAHVFNNDTIKNSFNMSYNVNKDNYFTFCDTRNGQHSIHSWDIIETTESEKMICEAIMKNRRKKIYGEKDGNPLSLDDIRNLIKNLDINDLNSLIKKKILTYKNGKYDFFNSKNSSGISGIYRIYTPDSHVFSTLTKTGVRDFVTEVKIPSNIKNKKEFFIEEIYRKGLYRKISIREGARIQGFPESMILPDNYSKSLGVLGNALWVNIVREIIKNLLITIN
jgi:DNA (cytosine-5)-methyltransferase 1